MKKKPELIPPLPSNFQPGVIFLLNNNPHTNGPYLFISGFAIHKDAPILSNIASELLQSLRYDSTSTLYRISYQGLDIYKDIRVRGYLVMFLSSSLSPNAIEYTDNPNGLITSN